MARFASGFSGRTPVRLEGAPNCILAGVGQWRGVRDFEHSTLCRAFQLDPNRFYFDLPSTVRGVGRNSTGYGGNGNRNRLVNGYVMLHGRDEPVGKLTICFESERFRDDDPSDMRDFLDLGHS